MTGAEAFTWFSDLGSGIVSLFPRRVVVDTTQRAVKWQWGKYPKLVEPGALWYWPLFDVIGVVEVETTTIDLNKQSVDLTDGRTACIDGYLTYKVKDPFRALTKYTDFQETLTEAAASIIAMRIQESATDIKIRAFSKSIQEELQKSKIGQVIEVEEFSINTFAYIQHTLMQWKP